MSHTSIFKSAPSMVYLYSAAYITHNEKNYQTPVSTYETFVAHGP
jgi:hydroxyacyl-ACP dehydratase HTD2-like protein with hotdog domain